LCACALLVSCASSSSEPKIATKIILENAPAWTYYTRWSIDATSIPVPIAKARLLGYDRGARRWIGLSGRTVDISRSRGEDYLDLPSVVTDAEGRFQLPLEHAVRYRLLYRGSKRERAYRLEPGRDDWVEVKYSRPKVSFQRISDSMTRVMVEADVRYNPYVTDDDVGIEFQLATDYNSEFPRQGEDLGTVYVDSASLTPGYRRAEANFTVPTESVLDMRVVVVVQLDFHPNESRGCGIATATVRGPSSPNPARRHRRFTLRRAIDSTQQALAVDSTADRITLKRREGDEVEIDGRCGRLEPYFGPGEGALSSDVLAFGLSGADQVDGPPDGVDGRATSIGLPSAPVWKVDATCLGDMEVDCTGLKVRELSLYSEGDIRLVLPNRPIMRAGRDEWSGANGLRGALASTTVCIESVVATGGTIAVVRPPGVALCVQDRLESPHPSAVRVHDPDWGWCWYVGDWKRAKVRVELTAREHRDENTREIEPRLVVIDAPQ
jgi:hypothetical protein